MTAFGTPGESFGQNGNYLFELEAQTGWTGGAATYDSGLKAHTYNRPAPGCSAPLSDFGPMCFAQPSGGRAETPCPKPSERY